MKKKCLQNVEYWRPILIVKKKNIMQQICSEHEAQKSRQIESVNFTRSVFFHCQDQSGIFGQSLAVF